MRHLQVSVLLWPRCSARPLISSMMFIASKHRYICGKLFREVWSSDEELGFPMPRGDLGFQGPPLVLFMSLDSPVSLLFPCFRCFELDRTCAACGVNAMSQAAFGFRGRRLNISTDRQCGLEKPGSLMVLNLSPIPAVLSTPAARRHPGKGAATKVKSIRHLCPILRLTHLQPLLTTFRSPASGCYYRTYGQTQDVTHELLLLA